jgi:DNA-binding SARP family transcriptional activator
MMQQLELTLLGGTQIHLGNHLVTGFRSSKAIALLSYLAVTGAPIPRPVVADLFWRDMSESHANDNLRVTLSNLRNLVGAHLLITRHSIAFDRKSRHWLDVREFCAAVENQVQAVTIEQLKAAADLYRGDFMAGFHVRDAPAFEDWASIQQMKLRDQAVRVFHTLVAHYARQSSAGRGPAVDYGWRLLALEPWQEEIHQLLMLLLAAGGQSAAANLQYENCKRLLWKESGVEPSPETDEMIARIRKGLLASEEAVQHVIAITTRLGTLPILNEDAAALAPVASRTKARATRRIQPGQDAPLYRFPL